MTKQNGQGITEYLCALVMAAMLAITLIAGLDEGGWVRNAYDSIFNSAGQMLVTALYSPNP
jgi:hypothetical protein